MLKITIDPLVLEKLKQSFPKPANRAQRALDKYVKLFEELLNKAEQYGRSKYESAFNLYSLNLRVLSQKGPQIGENSQRLHAWLAENNLQFYQVVERGSNLTGLVSKVKLNNLVKVERLFDQVGEQIRVATTDEQIDKALDLDVASCKEVFTRLYPNYYCYQSQAQRDAIYEPVPVDVKSLTAYVVWLNRDSTILGQHTVYERTRTALEILSVAKLTGGLFLQEIKRSEFGRTYYSGISVQSVSKDFRAAMLGNSWELDLRSSVIAFKLGFAQALTNEKFHNANHRIMFGSSYAYIQERDLFVNSLRKHIFEDEKNVTVELQKKLIKEAMTAISFGARANSVGWRLGNGTWKNPALKNIFKNAQWHENFLSHDDVSSFIAEQEMLDHYFFEKVSKYLPEILVLEALKSGKKLSKSKLVSYIYQHQETEMMNFVRAHLRKLGKPAVASIHDAVVIKKELINGQLADLNQDLRKEFGNDLLLLKQKGISGYKRFSIEPEQDFVMPTVEELLKRLGYSNLNQVSNQFKGI